MSAVIMRNKHAVAIKRSLGMDLAIGWAISRGHWLWSSVVVIGCGHRLWSSVVVINCGHRSWSLILGQSVWSSSRWLFRYGHWYPIFSKSGSGHWQNGAFNDRSYPLFHSWPLSDHNHYWTSPPTSTRWPSPRVQQPFVSLAIFYTRILLLTPTMTIALSRAGDRLSTPSWSFGYGRCLHRR